MTTGEPVSVIRRTGEGSREQRREARPAHRFTIDFAGPSPSICFTLAGLYLDHEYDARQICGTWLRMLSAHPRARDRVSGLLLWRP
jgi:hypothetical protein